MRSPAELVETIRSMCKERHTSLTKLEEKYTWANGTIGKWAKGMKYPPHDKLQKIAAEFGVSTDYLLGIEVEDKYSARFREELFCVIEGTNLSSDEEGAVDAYELKKIANSTYPLSLAEACDAAKKSGVSMDALLWRDEKKPAPDSGSGLSEAELRLVTLYRKLNQ